MSEEIIVKSFGSYEEILSLEGFEKEKEVSASNYDDIIGHYNLDVKLECCRLLESGGLCHRKHNYGFVVVLKDGTYSILGNRCALTKFAKDSKITITADRYEKERRRQEAIDGLRKLFEEKIERIENLNTSLNHIYELYKYIRNIKNMLPKPCVISLENMAKSGTRSVSVIIKYRRYYFDKESGKRKYEETAGEQTVGIINSISIFNKNTFEEPLRDIRESLRDLEQFHSVDEKATELQAKRFTAGILNPEKAVNLKQYFENLYLDLENVKPSVFSALCADVDDRMTTCKVFLRSKGMSDSNNQARKELSNLHDELIEQTDAYEVIYG